MPFRFSFSLSSPVFLSLFRRSTPTRMGGRGRAAEGREETTEGRGSPQFCDTGKTHMTQLTAAPWLYTRFPRIPEGRLRRREENRVTRNARLSSRHCDSITTTYETTALITWPDWNLTGLPSRLLRSLRTRNPNARCAARRSRERCSPSANTRYPPRYRVPTSVPIGCISCVQ